jgi:hypothetical protein
MVLLADAPAEILLTEVNLILAGSWRLVAGSFLHKEVGTQIAIRSKRPVLCIELQLQ